MAMLNNQRVIKNPSLLGNPWHSKFRPNQQFRRPETTAIKAMRQLLGEPLGTSGMYLVSWLCYHGKYQGLKNMKLGYNPNLTCGINHEKSGTSFRFQGQTVTNLF
jgi:hypothetical protein